MIYYLSFLNWGLYTAVSGDTALYVHRYFPRRSHPVWPDALALGLDLHGAKKSLLWGAFALSLAGEATQASAAYFVDERTACVYVLYVFVEPFPTPPGLRALDVLLEHCYSMIIWFKEKRKEKH